jgi:predicted nuclease with TOPRIM domain
MSEADTQQAVADTLADILSDKRGWKELFEESEKEADELRELNDALAAKVAEWKARAEAAEAALKAAEDDRHLTTPCA